MLWLGEPFVPDTDALRLAVDLVWVAIAIAFLVEFTVRAFVAPELGPFLRRHWWELGLIVLPFLRFLRALRAARAGRGITAAVLSTRSAGQGLRNRLFVLLLVTALVSAAGGRLLWEFGGYRSSYADAIHDSAMSTVTGSTLGNPGAFAQVLEVFLAVYSAVIIATIAGALGAFFLEGRRAEDSSAERSP